jgi:hypothetical protein
MAELDLREELKRGIKLHPRVVAQNLFGNPADLQKIASALPVFLPFKGKAYNAAIWVLDWDHRIPSRDYVLRLYVFYSAQGKAIGEVSLAGRIAQIEREDIYPEFDVSDFAGLAGDEIYEAEGPIGGELKSFRLVSEWRREIDTKSARKAEEIARASHNFREVASETRARPPGLGDLEAAEWCPPSESGHGRWGVDVWYLRSFNGMVGEGTAFLVDLEEEKVVRQRDFQFRAG